MKNNTVIESPLRVMTKEEEEHLAKVWDLSDEKKLLDEKNRKLKERIEIKNVGSYSPMDRLRTYSPV